MELNEAVNLSFDHVERTLEFSKFLNANWEEAEGLWPNLQVKLDNTSYYACLAMPLVRQLLEPSTRFLYSTIPANNRINWSDIKKPAKPKKLEMFSEVQRKQIEDAWILAWRMEVLRGRYYSLSTASELSYWCRYFLETSSSLITITSRLATT